MRHVVLRAFLWVVCVQVFVQWAFFEQFSRADFGRGLAVVSRIFAICGRRLRLPGIPLCRYLSARRKRGSVSCAFRLVCGSGPLSLVSCMGGRARAIVGAPRWESTDRLCARLRPVAPCEQRRPRPKCSLQFDAFKLAAVLPGVMAPPA